MDEKAIAKKALAALTRLRQGCNPFKAAELQKFLDALNLTLDDIKDNPVLKAGLKKAMQAQTEQEAV